MSFRSPDDAALPPGVSPLEPGDPHEIGGHRVLARIGQGGMGVVYLGEMRSGRRLAIKVVRREFAQDPEFRIRFRREMSAALKVRGRFLAVLIDADLDAPAPWLATEYVPGPTLAAAITDHGTMPEPAVGELVGQLAEALDAVHRADLVHRDLKPANVILGPDGPCLIDLGIARAADATSLTATGALLGTPVFMAPEQARDDDITPAADVWALGAVAFFAATGSMPFGRARPDVMYYRVVHEEPRLDDCPAPLRPFVEACLAKDPAARPTVREILDARPDLPIRPADTTTAPADVPAATFPAEDLPLPDTQLRAPAPVLEESPDPRRPRRPSRLSVLVAAVTVLVAGTAATLALTWPDGEPRNPGDVTNASTTPSATTADHTNTDDDATPDPFAETSSRSAAQEANAVVDECLVGRWEQTSMTDAWNLAGQHIDVTGWNGRVVTIDASGTETVDYGGAEPVVGQTAAGTLVDTYSGTALYTIATRGGTIEFTSVDNSQVSVGRDVAGLTETYTPPSMTPANVTYECDATTHTQRATSGAYEATFRRVPGAGDTSLGTR